VTDAGRDAFHKNEMPKPPRGLGRQTVRTLQWVAGDPNHDDLRFDLYVRGQGEAVWVLLAEGLVRNEYPWDTSTVADGWYEIKVVASDRADNAADRALEGFKITDPILVDNTAPEIQPIETQVTDGAVEVKFTAADATSRLVGAAYTVDSSLDWKTLEPTDGIFDAQKKEFHFTIPGLTPGAHRVAVRVSDLAANSGYSAQVVTMPEEKK